MSPTKRRRETIVRLIKEEHIRTQIELMDRLETMGFETTQATISRDMRTLGLSKAAGHYTLPMTKPPTNDLRTRLKGRVRQVLPAGPYMVVIHTDLGEANSVAVSIDSAAWPALTGTIAGDDTIFAACNSQNDRDDVIDRLRTLAF